ncbi:DNA polymerase ligase N-terminal domain-containing protein [Salinisphaera sp. Q1T1-3]|uniref:DNA polymerase ligase N-terminal domain-containing protein n=1 Tax=Salinisphaera sp. Q1T1-3 TaxID=2321229 RepID=UPI000E747BD8|nr:DNA polymerase ligase N-terminal domain-containing protein [Salinisphaera sp. Q1T1-3]RJS91943.1 DNA ligase [Salinisphaera sp. Q1T1-3]
MARDPLQTYRNKRRAEATPEPAGDEAPRNDEAAAPIFVIQKHDASSQHYDFRLEIDGVLKSWAVPKGPSTDPRDKQLAIETEDHPLDYADFEGVIPDAEYGGGTVMVWDIGPFDNARGADDNGRVKSLAEAWADGHLTVRLHGTKLTGGYALTHFRTEGDKRQWLLVKMDDDAADARRNPVSTADASVLTGRSTQQIADEEGDQP